MNGAAAGGGRLRSGGARRAPPSRRPAMARPATCRRSARPPRGVPGLLHGGRRSRSARAASVRWTAAMARGGPGLPGSSCRGRTRAVRRSRLATARLSARCRRRSGRQRCPAIATAAIRGARQVRRCLLQLTGEHFHLAQEARQRLALLEPPCSGTVSSSRARATIASHLSMLCRENSARHRWASNRKGARAGVRRTDWMNLDRNTSFHRPWAEAIKPRIALASPTLRPPGRRRWARALPRPCALLPPGRPGSTGPAPRPAAPTSVPPRWVAPAPCIAGAPSYSLTEAGSGPAAAPHGASPAALEPPDGRPDEILLGVQAPQRTDGDKAARAVDAARHTNAAIAVVARTSGGD